MAKATSDKPMRRYQVIRGLHHHDGKFYGRGEEAGDIFETTTDLKKIDPYSEKFVELDPVSTKPLPQQPRQQPAQANE